MPLTRAEVLEMTANGENSLVEFKRDDTTPEDVAKELVAFLNLSGGTLLLGVEDDGTVSGLIRDNTEEWVAELCRTHIDPPIVPVLQRIRNVVPAHDVFAVTVPAGPNKPYARFHRRRRDYFIRVGSTSREASQDELIRMSQASGRFRFGFTPVVGASLDELDRRRLRDYFVRLLGQQIPDEADEEGWLLLLTNLELARRWDDIDVPTADGLLLFGRNPRRFLPQAGIRALAFAGRTRDYAALADEVLNGPIVSLFSEDERTREINTVDPGVIEQGLQFIQRFAPPQGVVRQDGTRQERIPYPLDALREALVNAIAHRDYSIGGADVMLAVYEDRIEITSPGRLPNAATVESIQAGFRYSRNQTLMNVLRDYHYVEARGMGIRDKIIPSMLTHTQNPPEFIATDHSFAVILRR